MNEKQIRAALKVAECGSMTGAASQLFVSVQGLKKQLDVLEREELGCDLFVRTNKGISLTEAGRVFCEEAPSLLSYAEGFIAKVRRAESKFCDLRISIWENKQFPLLDASCVEYRRLYPDTHITFVPTSPSRSVDDIVEGVADLGFFGNSSIYPDVSKLELSSLGDTLSFRCLMMPGTDLARVEGPIASRDLSSYRVAFIGKRKENMSLIEPEDADLDIAWIPSFDRYEIMSYCGSGGVCICDKYLAATIPELVARPLSWVTPVEILIGYKKDPPIQVARFIEVAQFAASCSTGEQDAAMS